MHNGRNALFRDDAWEQLPILANQEGMEQVRNSMMEKGWTQVHQYWKRPDSEFVRIWKDPADWPAQLDPEVRNRTKAELSLRQIRIKNGSNIIRWLNRGEGTYKVGDAYLQATNLSEAGKRKDWQCIWQPGIWPKIAPFLWLTLSRKVLTWDKLRKKGFEGPSICMLCRTEEGTLPHLFCTPWGSEKDLGQWGNDVSESQGRQGHPNKPNHWVVSRTVPKPHPEQSLGDISRDFDVEPMERKEQKNFQTIFSLVPLCME